MNQIRRKLHSDSGASMMLALALLLICIMVSSVIVAAAANGSTRNEANLLKQRDYLAVTSSAQYIAENLNPAGGAQFVGVIQTNEMPCNKYKNYAMASGIELDGEFVFAYAVPMPKSMIPDIDNSEIKIEQFYLYVGKMSEDITDKYIFCEDEAVVKVDEEATTFTGVFAELMNAAASEVFLHQVEYSSEFTMKVDDERLPQVKCKFTMLTDYSVAVVIKSMSEESDYTMTVRMSVANINTDAAEDKEIVKCSKEHEYFYEYCDEYGNIHTSELLKYRFEHEVSNPATTITWSAPVISKGGE